MRFLFLGLLASVPALVRAYQDTSPFFLFSTSELLIPSTTIASSSSIEGLISQELSKCPSKTYVLVLQPGVHIEDYQGRSSAPHLRRKLLGTDRSIKSSTSVHEVKGDVSLDTISSQLKGRCGAKHFRIDASAGSFAIPEEIEPRVITLQFPALPTGASRKIKLQHHDAFLSSLLDTISSDSYTVIYTTSFNATSTSPSAKEAQQYEMDDTFASPIHMELKRAFDIGKRESNANITLPDGGLFERYQYFGPGIFIGLVVSFILLSILYVGISGIAGLQVSYAAFDKEMGPAAQKKQQQ